MREVVIRSWCDECAANGKDVEGTAIDITWRNREASLDLCDEHAAPFNEVERLIATYGHFKKRKHQKSNGSIPLDRTVDPTDVPMNADGSYTCPECNHTVRTPQGMGAHRRFKHGVTGRIATASTG